MCLVLKLTLAPLLIALASLAGRRWGPRIAGWIVGFPIVAGPTLLFFAVEQGTVFTSEAAYKTVVGLFPYCAFALSYAYYAQRYNRWWSLFLAWGMFFISALIFYQYFALGLWPTWALATLALSGTWFLLPKFQKGLEAPVHAPWDLLVRMLAAGALVYVLTELAHVLGPTWSGLLTPFPVAASVLTTAAHIHHGYQGAMRILGGIVVGLLGFALFVALLSCLIVPLGISAAFTLSLAFCAVAQVFILRFWPKG